MVSVRDKAARIGESRGKIRAPFVLDESLCLYSPQDNLDALHHPRIRAWFRFITEDYEPILPSGRRRVLLLMPCTKTKPYPLSWEHIRINQALLAAGFQPSGDAPPPGELVDAAPPGISPEVFDLSPLRDAVGTVVHRAVVSEPLALVPYEHILSFAGVPSPASAYDDPGLFENRGNAVSPWRADSTAVAVSAHRWQWGDAERRAYVEMHNEMSRLLATVLQRLAPFHDRRIAWVAPGLTHRSFVVAAEERAANQVVRFRKVGAGRLALIGANDRLPADLRIACLPTLVQCRDARQRLAVRLGCPVSRVGGAYSRGGGDATPLALPELLDDLIAALRA
jgi:hypothetical protein